LDRKLSNAGEAAVDRYVIAAKYTIVKAAGPQRHFLYTNAKAAAEPFEVVLIEDTFVPSDA